jgi:hypothetical protein
VVDAGQLACDEAVVPLEHVTLDALDDEDEVAVVVAAAYCTHCPVVALYCTH